MNYYEVLVAQEYTATHSVFTYASDQSLTPMQYVIVPLQTKKIAGIVVKNVQKPTFATKHILQSLPYSLLPSQRYLLRFLKDYYGATEAQVLQLFLPSYLSKITADTVSPAISTPPKLTLPSLTKDQNNALNILQNNPTDTILLHGDTGTGKTRVYIEQAAALLTQGKTTLILSPEIALIPQLQKEFTKVFGPTYVASYHSALTPNKRAEIWQAIANGSIKILIGTRSALFLPINQLGLVVVDESHEPAYKQEEGVRYHASRVASVLAMQQKAQLILASATPLVSDVYLAKERSKHIIRMNQTAVTSDSTSSIEVVDMKSRDEFTKHPLLSNTLLTSITDALGRSEQVLIYLNRRGTARIVLCSDCGWQAMCPTCNIALTYHQDHHSLKCHTCGYSASVPVSCPTCTNTDIIFKSAGTKALAAWLQNYFSSAKVARFDTDNTKAESLAERHHDVASGNIDILVGTQMLVKGLDLPKLSVVGLIAADLSLQIPDFSAEERTYQLITQAIGRVGRGHRNGTTIIQTFNPNNNVIQQAKAKNYEEFYTTQLKQRIAFDFAPITFMATFWISKKTADAALNDASKVLTLICKKAQNATFLGPVVTFHPKKRGMVTAQIVVKTKHRSELLVLSSLLPSGWQYDLDPINLL